MQGIPINWRQMVTEYYPEQDMKIEIYEKAQLS